jgi:tRNA dimethylallyltransferase
MSNSTDKYLIVIAGPTAVGKTALCLNLAQNLNTEIISADSRQFFKELNIGTAKPNEKELATVPHHFINSHSIQETYSAGDFERDVLQLLEELFTKNQCVILTGGSGFYIKAVLEGLDNLPQPDPKLRLFLTQRLETEGIEVLQKEIQTIDPLFATTQEIHNPQRVVRALEVFHTSGIPISTYQKQQKAIRPFKTIDIAINRAREILYNRIDERMDLMLQDGLVQEATDLLAFRSHHALQTVGYKEVFAYLDGAYDYKEMVRLLKQNTRRYAKRQITWFKHQGDFHWFDADQEADITAYIQSIIHT